MPLYERHNHRSPNYAEVRDVRMLPAQEAIRYLSRIDGPVASAVNAIVQVGMSGYQVSGYDVSTHQYSMGATRVGKDLIAKMNTVYNADGGYSDKRGMDLTLEALLWETSLTGGACMEMVLNAARMPDFFSVFDYWTLEWHKASPAQRMPRQRKTGFIIEQGPGRPPFRNLSNTSGPPTPGQLATNDLNFPTVFISELNRRSDSAYGCSPFESALSMIYYHQEFIEDMRRVVRQSGHPRMVVSLDSEKVHAAAAPDVQNDPTRLQAWMEEVKTNVESALETLEPEDVIVTYDSAEVSQLENKGEKADYADLLKILSGLLATSMKTSPSVLGLRLDGSQSLSNTESLIYLKLVKAIQRPVEEIMTRAMTMAARLMGINAYLLFEFKPIDLRPENELEAFFTMKQARVLELLSLGFLDDDETALRLGSGERPSGMEDLTGTRFYSGSGDSSPPSPNEDPQGRALNPDTPASGGGKDNAQRPSNAR